jgi:hypothetical protein
MQALQEHERGFLQFLVEPTRRRMETLLSLGPKRRDDVRSLLDHSVSLDERFAEHLSGAESFPAPLEVRLRKLGAPATCHVVAANPAIDGLELPLDEALARVIGRGGAYISCVPGRLGVFEFGEMKRTYLLRC